jgi:hypothetical protein
MFLKKEKEEREKEESKPEALAPPLQGSLKYILLI